MSYLRYTGTGIRFNLKNFLSFTLFGLMFMFVWGYHGNCYGTNTCIRFGYLPLCGFGFEFAHNHRTTTISKRATRGWWWNSEHLAYRFGNYHDGGRCNPESWTYNHRWLGQHHYI